MKRTALVILIAGSGAFAVSEGFGQHAGTHTMIAPTELNWTDLPALPGVKIASTERLGIHPDWVEAIAFAWLAQRSLKRQAGNLPEVTGAKKLRVLGAIYAA